MPGLWVNPMCGGKCVEENLMSIQTARFKLIRSGIVCLVVIGIGQAQPPRALVAGRDVIARSSKHSRRRPASPQQPVSQPPMGHITRTRVVLLGTGTPVPDPDRSGPATAIVVDDSVYLVDFGPGVVRRAKAAVLNRSITALEPSNLKVAFA